MRNTSKKCWTCRKWTALTPSDGLITSNICQACSSKSMPLAFLSASPKRSRSRSCPRHSLRSWLSCSTKRLKKRRKRVANLKKELQKKRRKKSKPLSNPRSKSSNNRRGNSSQLRRLMTIYMLSASSTSESAKLLMLGPIQTLKSSTTRKLILEMEKSEISPVDCKSPFLSIKLRAPWSLSSAILRLESLPIGILMEWFCVPRPMIIQLLSSLLHLQDQCLETSSPSLALKGNHSSSYQQRRVHGT